MLRSFLKGRNVLGFGSNLLRTFTSQTEISETNVNDNLVHKLSVEDAFHSKNKEEKVSVLDKCNEDLSHIVTYLKPTFNLAAYVNRSHSLQELLKLGVDLHKIERKCKPDAASYIASLDFEKDIKEHVVFLYDLGLEVDNIGNLITKNPFIFKESLDDLKCRINYLKYKKFDKEMIMRIIGTNPLWLSYSSQQIDELLGFFQKHFSLTGNEVRTLTVQKPRLITYSRHHIKVNYFVLKEEMGFTPEEVKIILLSEPVVFMKHQNNILKTFQYLHIVMKIPLEDIVACPKMLTCRLHRLQERYMFLQKVNRVQFDPSKPNYISMLAMVSGTDSHFATELAKSSILAYNEFLKSL